MKFAFSTSIFRSRPLLETVETLARSGFCAVEIVSDRPQAFPEDLTAADIAALSDRLKERRVSVCNISACIAGALGEAGHHPSWIEEEWKRRESRIRYTLDCLRLAAAMGIPHITTIAAGPIPETMNQNDAWRLFVADLQRVLPLAKKLGVKLLVQPEPGLLIESSEQMRKFLAEFDFHESLGVDFNVGCFFCANEDPCSAWERLKQYVYHIHVEDVSADRAHRHIPLGQGAIDIPAFFQCIEKSGYAGYATIKLDHSESKPEDIVANSLRYLRENGFAPQETECS